MLPEEFFVACLGNREWLGLVPREDGTSKDQVALIQRQISTNDFVPWVIRTHLP